jgi:RNA polymerase sigma-70 factor (ECF subfamily)
MQSTFVVPLRSCCRRHFQRERHTPSIVTATVSNPLQLCIGIYLLILMRHSSSTYALTSDLPLVDSVQQMDSDALIKIFDRYSRPLYNYALRLCSDPITADGIVGDVFAKLLDQLSKGHGPRDNVRSYLYEIAYHLVVDNARYSRRQVPFDGIDAFRYDNSSLYANLENRLLFEKVMFAIHNELTTDQRHVIILRFLEGFSLRETASIIGKQVSHVKVIQNRAIAKLRKVVDSVVI